MRTKCTKCETTHNVPDRTRLPYVCPACERTRVERWITAHLHEYRTDTTIRVNRMIADCAAQLNMFSWEQDVLVSKMCQQAARLQMMTA